MEMHCMEAAVDAQVDLREEIAARKAEVAGAATAYAGKTNDLKQAQEKLAEATLLLHQADVRGAQLSAEAGAFKRELAKEQGEFVALQVQLATVQEQLEKAKHWNDIRVRCCHACDCCCLHLFNHPSKRCMLSSESARR
jgi:chromosome segregation ATPase